MSEKKYYGIYQGIVTSNKDPQKRGRIKVQCPSVLSSHTESAWCDPVIPVAYDNGGDFCIPQKSEAVWLLFIDGDVNKPVWLGGWWSNSKTPLGNNYSNIEDVRIISFDNCFILFQRDNVSFNINGNDSLLINDGEIKVLGDLNVTGSIINTVLQNSIEKLKVMVYNERQIEVLNELIFDGSSYINTMFKPSNKSKIEIKFSFSAMNGFVFGSKTSNSSGDSFCFLVNTSSIYPQFGEFNNSVSNTLIEVNEPHTLILSQEGSYLDNNILKDDYSSMNFQSVHNIYVGGLNSNENLESRTFKGSIYYAKIWDDNILKRFLIPCVYGSKRGMYDKLNDVFYDLTNT